MKKILILMRGFGSIFCSIQDSLVLKIQGKSFKLLAENSPVLTNYFGDHYLEYLKSLT